MSPTAPILFVLLMSCFCGASIAAITPGNPFAAGVDHSEPVTFNNPVLPGFYSDPSVVKVGDFFYMVSSTFEYFPAIPVFRSRDLVNWQQIGHVVTRPEQLPSGVNIFAVTLRFHDGLFYIITTNVGYGGNFIMTATDPAGQWSKPVWLDIPGIDPDLFFDDDGKVYVANSEFHLYEINPHTGEVINDAGAIWATTGGRYAEAPHIYKKDGWYYLMAAEGGTEEAHSVTIARSHDIAGPYYSNPANPILTHVNRAGQQNPIQGLGHGDMVQADDGSWWMLFHGYRSLVPGGVHHTLGRETSLAPVDWPKYGWPQVNGNGTITPQMRVPTLPLSPLPAASADVTFSQPLGFEWNTVQAPRADAVHHDPATGTLTLTGSAYELGNAHQQGVSFIGRRVQHPAFYASTVMDFMPQGDNEKAGLTLMNNGTHFDLNVVNKQGHRYVQAEFMFGGITYTSEAFRLAPGKVTLIVESKGESFTFSFQQGEVKQAVETVSARYLSSETVGGFSGTYVGMYATGSGKASLSKATYHSFKYKQM
ncbi:glycoside hydrolase family 43 protein [Alteromonas gilva]|uniref:Glycoside hydrolase family 43 protein n=1 Tax=Alteromonas gilva TaxID=2987522 RepID=A0ABT5KXZ9_9ALTE|nr:glycoside hydrolase family 43 protein [Alteromonas gilva]MDC8829653.1 glycoside hydrolase family 43 protein [Alteromonas gilva]